MNRNEVLWAFALLALISGMFGAIWFLGQQGSHGYNIAANNHQDYTCTSPNDPSLLKTDTVAAQVPKYNLYNGTKLVGVCINTNQGEHVFVSAALLPPSLFLGIGMFVAAVAILVVIAIFMADKIPASRDGGAHA